MDVKTLSTVIGHVSSSTTLNVYAHVTDEMRRVAAVKIDRGIGKTTPRKSKQRPGNQFPALSRLTRDSGAKRAQVVLPKSTRSSGRDAIPPFGQTAKSTPATSTLTARRNAKSFWQN